MSKNERNQQKVENGSEREIPSTCFTETKMERSKDTGRKV